MLEIDWDSECRAYRLTTEAVLPATRHEVFDFFSDAFQLERITPPLLRFRVLTPAPIQIKAGTLIDYKLRVHGVPIKWKTEISTWDPPYSFTDRQLKGPYRLWEHLHTFEEVEDGTLMRDQVHYRVPGGAIAHWLVVERDLREIFQFRLNEMLKIFSDRDCRRPEDQLHAPSSV